MSKFSIFHNNIHIHFRHSAERLIDVASRFIGSHFDECRENWENMMEKHPQHPELYDRVTATTEYFARELGSFEVIQDYRSREKRRKEFLVDKSGKKYLEFILVCSYMLRVSQEENVVS